MFFLCIWLEQNVHFTMRFSLLLDLNWDSIVFIDFSGALLMVLKGSFHF